MLRKQCAFAGVELITFTIMSNHFHLLIRIKPHYLEEVAPPEGLAEKSPESVYLSDQELLNRYEAFYGNDAVPLSTYSLEELKSVLKEDGEEAQIARNKIVQRMGKLAPFCRRIKEKVYFMA